MLNPSLETILEALLYTAGKPLTLEAMQTMLSNSQEPLEVSLTEIQAALTKLEANCQERANQLVLVASGYQFIVRPELTPWLSGLWPERPQKYTRSLLETLALIAYKQPITRGEIEAVRGVAVNTNVLRTLEERGWIKIIGHKEVPGRPALYATTKTFLDYFGLQRLDELPSLPEIMQLTTPPTDIPNDITTNAESITTTTSTETLS
jgi:segregation and condensation protein B